MTAMSLGALSQAIRCTYPKCNCECFQSSKNQIRACQNCKHGWVAHALDKLISSNLYPGMPTQTEPVSPSIVFDIASLVLYDCQALPIKTKILLDRLFSGLQHEEVLQILHGFGWSYEDYARGYILQDPTGRVLEKWSIILREEENIVLQQFLRFAETRNIAQEILLHDNKSPQEITTPPSQNNPAKSESDIRKFIERNNMALLQSYNLALRRAFDNPQSLFSAMGGFPAAHLNMAAAAAAASQFGRGFPPTSSMMTMPTAGFPQTAIAKAEPITMAEQSTRRLSEPYDLTNKRSPESQKSCSPALSTSTGNLQQALSTSTTPTIESRAMSDPNTSGGSSNLRKATSPMPNLVRRPTSPPPAKGWPFNNPAFGQTVFVTSSGKKRVLCTACNKTFCDKGALKIHYSAVHLKEMHQCTIPGCNMMFSSRRSRNRHSANPNPKLHTPQTRRPRERYDASQDSMISMMSMPHGIKHDDGGSSVEENDIMDGKLLPKEYQGVDKSNNGSESGQGDDYVDEDFDDELPTQVKLKQESPLYGSSKRKRLMPTRVTSAAELGLAEDDNKSEAGKSVASESHTMEDSLDVGDSNDTINQNVYMRDGEPGEIRTRSPAEPGEVIRDKIGEDKKNLTPFHSGLGSPGKQAMHSLFNSFLPQNGDHPASDFWSNFIQQTAAAQEAKRLAEEREEVEDDKYTSSIDGCKDVFSNKQNRDLHTMNLKLHRKLFKNSSNSDMSVENDTEAKQCDCKYCDKTFPTAEALHKHVDTAHQGQETLYGEQTYSNHIDSLKSKTPVIA